jgi:phage terminase large subunit-like protein
MWGYTRAVHKERLWTEMTIPPTRWGRAIRWVESYAGFSDDPGVLWDLYETAVVHGYRHPAFPDLPVYVNDRANMFCYWDSGDAARRMPWQVGDSGRLYYAAQAETMRAEEFDRVHRNQWATSLMKAIDIDLWDKREDSDLRGRWKLDSRLPCVMAVDASVSYDCCAAVLATRHPDPSHPEDDVAIRKVRIWEPPRGAQIDLGDTIEACVYDWTKRYNVVEVAYDRYQLHSIMTKARKSGIKTYDFSQVGERNLSDKGFYDWLVVGKLFHDGDPYLRAHVDNAAVKIQGEKYRFVKPEQTSKVKSTRHRRPIDALVAASMGVHRCKHLNLDL